MLSLLAWFRRSQVEQLRREVADLRARLEALELQVLLRGPLK